MDTQQAIDVFGEFIKQGVLAAGLVAVITGVLVPKYIVDELRERLKLKDEIIARQSALIERLAEKAEARRRDDP